MRKLISLLVLVTLLFSNVTHADAAKIWTKYVAKDKSYSFHYPSGWKVTANDSMIGIENAKSNEELIMAILPYEKQKTSKQLASSFITLIKDANPNLKASNWRSLSDSMGDHVVFDLSDKIGTKKHLGLGLVIKDMGQAMWFSYFSPEADYYQIRAYSIMEGFISSMATGTTSVAPKIDYTIDVAANIDKNAKGFMFVLEFALGAPLTKSQEDAIIKELKSGWRHLSKEELQVYDEYPILVKSIMKAKQKDMEKLRSSLEEVIKEWLDETDQKDPAVKIIKSSLDKRGKVVIKGSPPLTEMSLQAYSEIIAYSKLLQKDSSSSPDKITKKSVDSVKKQVKEVWKNLSKEDREDIATTPGLWVCIRSQYRFGTKDQKKEIRDSVKKIEQAKEAPKADSSKTTKDEPMSMAAHWSMMQIQKMTFNSYMWSRGYNYSITTGKMW
ncbi:MAG: hypothetical protein GX129_07455 [Clostridiales bacterium]|nr:hypothetical protein [Clostridiales bacterium]